ncbi:MAG: response regulator [Fuerstiella sp.]|nr:response regulator [Fuerstiella sp.]
MASILIVEDNATQATQIRLRLEHDGHSVLVADDGKQATLVLAETRPDIIITDLNMPEMDGLELVEYVRMHHSEIPVVLLTADGTEDTGVKALRKGATSYLPKSELGQSLIGTVSEIMDLIETRRSRNEVMESLIAAESTYVVPNDHRFAGQVISHLEEQLRTMNYSDDTGMVRISMALREAVANAIDHGNLELDSDLRDDDGSAYTELGRQRARQEPWMGRRVTVTSRVTPSQVRYTISDQGSGFDPSSLPDPLDPENLLRTHGRGLMLIRSFMDEVTHNAAGNEITMVKHRESLRNYVDSDSAGDSDSS